MSTALVVWGAVVVAVIAYPLMAGVVYRHTIPPLLPFVQGRHKRGPAHRFGDLECEGESARYDFCACAKCWAAHESREARDRARRAAWVWPITGLLAIPRACFDAGADITTTPTPTSQPEQSETTKAATP